jgi:acyl CoA:acetate/3-ketoacid CoA transferase alpha subunit
MLKLEQARRDGQKLATVLIGGFGTAGIPNELIEGLIEQGARDLTWSTTTRATATPAWPRC